MKRFKDAAARALQGSYGGQIDPDGVVERLSVDVQLGGHREIVSMRLSGDRLLWSCTCGELECEHAQTALGMVSDAADTLDPEQRRITAVYEPAPASGADVRTVEQSDQAVRADTAGLRSILEDVLGAVVRSGVAGGMSPAIEEALERLVKAAPSPLPLGISRWIGRLKDGLARHDVDAVARVLDGATRVVEDLADKQPPEDALRRIVSWLGALSKHAGDVERISDRTMLEVAREWLPGVERAGVERRYLVDLGSGEVFREERSRAAQTASLGGCPRVVNVGLASVERGANPRRIRLLQYATTPAVDDGAWNQLAQWASRRFEPLATGYREAIEAFPGLAEPFALVAPDSLSGGDSPVLLDESGRPLPCAGDPAVLMHLADRAGSPHRPLWICGRLVDPGGVLALVPLSAAVNRHGRLCYTQM